MMTLTDSAAILVPNGSEKRIELGINNIAQFMTWSKFVCQFNIEGRVTSVNAKIVEDRVVCDPMEFTFTARVPNITASIAVMWGPSKPLDNPGNVNIVIYN